MATKKYITAIVDTPEDQRETIVNLVGQGLQMALANEIGIPLYDLDGGGYPEIPAGAVVVTFTLESRVQE